MSDKKHIDRLFQEKLKHFEATPEDAVWEKIHKTLHKDKRERRIIPLWWKLGGVAALFALLLTVGIQLRKDPNLNTINPIVDTENQTSDTINNTTLSNSNASNDRNQQENSFDNESKIVDENVISSNNSNNQNRNTINNQGTDSVSEKNQNGIVSNSNQNSIKTNVTINRTNANQQKNNTNQKAALASSENSDKIKSNSNKETQNNASSVIDKILEKSQKDANTSITGIANEIKKDSIEDTLNLGKKELTIEDALAEVTKEEETEKKTNRWNISPNVAPVYFNSMGKGSTLDEQFSNNTKSGEVTMSYGIGGSFNLNNRLKIRAGINKVDLGYNTKDVIVFQSVGLARKARESMKNVNMNSNMNNLTFLSTETLDRNETPEIINTETKSSINQRFGFIEVPLEMEYAIINKKFGINVIGGFSTLIVDKNEIYSVVEGTEIRIGEANNINNMSYSANFGLGINYNISEKIKLNVEPTFKYQINTFSNSSGDFQPYFIGIYTGLSYKF